MSRRTYFVLYAYSIRCSASAQDTSTSAQTGKTKSESSFLSAGRRPFMAALPQKIAGDHKYLYCGVIDIIVPRMFPMLPPSSIDVFLARFAGSCEFSSVVSLAPQLVDKFHASRIPDVSAAFVNTCTKLYNKHVKCLYDAPVKKALLAPMAELLRCFEVIASCGPNGTQEMMLARCNEECSAPLVFELVSDLVSGCFTRDDADRLPDKVKKDCLANLRKIVKEDLFEDAQTKSKYALHMFLLLFKLFLAGKSIPADHATTADLLHKYPEFEPLGEPELLLLCDYWFYMAAGVELFGAANHKGMLMFIVFRLVNGKDVRELITGSGQSAQCDWLEYLYEREGGIPRAKPFELRLPTSKPAFISKRKQEAVADDSSVGTDTDSSVSTKRSRCDSSATAATVESADGIGNFLSFDQADGDLAGDFDACSFAHPGACNGVDVSPMHARAVSVPLSDDALRTDDAARDELPDIALSELGDELEQSMGEVADQQSATEPDMSGFELRELDVPRDFVNADMSVFTW